MATNDHMLVTAVGIPEGAISVSFGAFELESGQIIEDAVICYTAYGKLNEVRAAPSRGFFFPTFFSSRANDPIPSSSPTH